MRKGENVVGKREREAEEQLGNISNANVNILKQKFIEMPR